MDIFEAIWMVERGSAVTRRAWGDPDMIVSREVRAGDIVGGSPMCAVSRGPQIFTQDDLSATDWYVVAAIH